MLRSVLAALALFSVATAYAPAAAAQAYFVPAQPMSSQLWQADLDTLVEELELRHADPYPGIEPATFRAAAAALKVQIPSLSDDQVVVEIGRLLTRIGEGHTAVHHSDSGVDDRRLPLQFHRDKEGMFVLAASPEYSRLLGARVVTVGAMPTGQLLALLEPLIARDNDFTIPKAQPDYARIAGLLVALGATDDVDAVPLTVQHPGRPAETVVVAAVPRRAPIDWRFIPAGGAPPFWLDARGSRYWRQYLPETKSLYVQFNSADISVGEQEESLRRFCDELVSFIENNDVEKLIVDLRRNTGGNSHNSRHILHALIRAEKINQPGKLFVLISNTTFSAATTLATQMDANTEAVFIGEPTGGKPNSFGDFRRIRLPHSGLIVRYSAHRRNDSGNFDLRPAIFPDVPAPLTLTAYAEGRDPGLEAVLTYQPRRAAGERVLEVFAQRGVEAALLEHRRLRRDEAALYQFDVADLAGLGDDLLEQGRTEDAIRVFLDVVDIYPWAAHIHDSLGQAYLAQGDRTSAMDHFHQAFRMQPAFTRWRDLIISGQ